MSRPGKTALAIGGLAGAMGLGSRLPSMPLSGLFIPFALAALAGLFRFTELSILLLQDYLTLVTTPISWFVALPALPMSLPFIAIWALEAGWRLVFGKQKLDVSWGLLLHLFFAGLVLVSYLLIAEHTEYANSKIFLVLTINLFSFVAGATFTYPQLRRVFGWIVALGLLVALLTYQAFVTGQPTMPGRYSALLMNPIWTCRLALLGAVTAYFTFKRKLGAIAFALLVLPSMILTGSRGPLVAALVSSLLMGLVWWIRPLKSRVPAAIAVGLLAMSLFSAPVTAQETRNLGDDSTAQSRVQLYEIAMAGFADHPLFGTGIGGYESLVDITEFEEERIVFPHNIFLEVAVEMGVVGSAAFLAMVAYFLWLGWRHLQHARDNPADPTSAWGLVATAGFLNLFIAAQFSGDLVSNHSLWFYMGLMTGVRTIRRQELQG